jgi:hypothetical protein
MHSEHKDGSIEREKERDIFWKINSSNPFIELGC